MLTRLQLQTIQIARREVAKLSNGHFTEEMFRSLLRLQGDVRPDETGHVSSKNLTNAGFDKVMAWMEENGFRDRLPGRGETYWRDRCGYRTGYCTPRQVHEIQLLAPQQKYDLRAMCLKFSNGHSAEPAKLTMNQAQKLIEMLKDAAARCAEKMPAGVDEGGASTGDTAGSDLDNTSQLPRGNKISSE